MSKNIRKKNKYFNRNESNRFRISVFKSNLNIYAQIIDDLNNITIISSNSLKLVDGKKSDHAIIVGEDLAKKALKNNISNVYLDRKNLRYTGRLKLLCDSARKSGLLF